MRIFNKKIIAIFFILLTSFCSLLSYNIALADDYGLDAAAQEAGGGTNPFSTDDLGTYAGKIIGAVLAFVGILFFILMIYAGILWMTARGNEEQVSKAKDLIMAAIIGLIIVMSAYAITAFVGQQVSK